MQTDISVCILIRHAYILVTLNHAKSSFTKNESSNVAFLTYRIIYHELLYLCIQVFKWSKLLNPTLLPISLLKIATHVLIHTINCLWINSLLKFSKHVPCQVFKTVNIFGIQCMVNLSNHCWTFN